MKLNLICRIHHAATLAGLMILTLVIANTLGNSGPDQVVNNGNDAQKELETSTKARTIEPVDANKLASLHLFGTAVTVSEKQKVTQEKDASTFVADKSVNPAELPPTSLNLSIDGVFTHADEFKGHAIITNSRGKSSAYRVGDVLENNVKLYGVYKDYVVVNNNNKLESLKLPEFATRSVSQLPGRRDIPRQLANRKRDS